jgi:D-alanine-D-alanine ligase
MANIEIVRTNLYGLSSLSLKSALGIKKALLTVYENVVITTVSDISDLEALVVRNPDLVFLGLKFMHTSTGSEIWLAEFFASHGIATTGSNSKAHRLELDKSKAKARVVKTGLVTSPYFVVKKDSIYSTDNLITFPMFVKPSNRGGGLGIDRNSVVHSNEQLHAKVASIQLIHGSDSLVEKYLSGREFSVAILLNSNGQYDTLPIELIAPLNIDGNRLLSLEVKNADAEDAIEIIDKSLEKRISTLALAVFEALGASDYGRIDIRLDESGIPNFLEANLIPSLMDNYGSFPKACMLHLNLDHTDMILQIAELAIARQPVPTIISA